MEELSANFLLNNYSWITINTSLNDFKQMSVTAHLPESQSEVIDSVLYTELFHSILREILSELYKTKNYEYLNLTDLDLNFYKVSEILVNKISSHDYKSVIVNSNTLAHLQENYLFSTKDITNVSQTLVDSRVTYIYKRGYILDKSIWIDPFIKYSDNKICLFDNIEINISNFEKHIFEHKVTLSVNYAYKVKDSKMIYILFDKGEEMYKQYIADIRDRKIDNLLK